MADRHIAFLWYDPVSAGDEAWGTPVAFAYRYVTGDGSWTGFRVPEATNIEAADLYTADDNIADGLVDDIFVDASPIGGTANFTAPQSVFTGGADIYPSPWFSFVSPDDDLPVTPLLDIDAAIAANPAAEYLEVEFAVSSLIGAEYFFTGDDPFDDEDWTTNGKSVIMRNKISVTAGIGEDFSLDGTTRDGQGFLTGVEMSGAGAVYTQPFISTPIMSFDYSGVSSSLTYNANVLVQAPRYAYREEILPSRLYINLSVPGVTPYVSGFSDEPPETIDDWLDITDSEPSEDTIVVPFLVPASTRAAFLYTTIAEDD